MSQARCTTASAPRSSPPRSSRLTSACAHVVLATFQSGRRRATPMMSCTLGSRSSARTKALPTLPVAPMTTTRMPACCPPARRACDRLPTCRRVTGMHGPPVRLLVVVLAIQLVLGAGLVVVAVHGFPIIGGGGGGGGAQARPAAASGLAPRPTVDRFDA